MWIVGKVKKFQLERLKENLKQKEKDGYKIEVYAPKFVFTKKIKNKFTRIEKVLLDNYVFFNFNKDDYEYANKSLKFWKKKRTSIKC